jgi:hypothetical protein
MSPSQSDRPASPPRRARWLSALLAPLLLGCASQADVDRAVSDDLQLTSRVMGFALDADVTAVETRLGLLRAFAGDPRYPALEEALGTKVELEAKLERIKESRSALLETSQKLRDRYRSEDE